MNKIEEIVINPLEVEIMELVQEVFIKHGIDSRRMSGLLMRMVFDLYKENSNREAYYRFLDKCKDYWHADEKLKREK